MFGELPVMHCEGDFGIEPDWLRSFRHCNRPSQRNALSPALSRKGERGLT
jgi:hypothetical protein